eukprot:TRINITY_DN127022_c0_g1_i1.p2 TRINITY_DN127022_c0_g1~~TRINITY_DN127022_c0_g1_i1.p2  ORF type:complete len:149 (-),score=19.69 TRINITY_DN127022_c0_g1_i1:197-643(-)
MYNLSILAKANGDLEEQLQKLSEVVTAYRAGHNINPCLVSEVLRNVGYLNMQLHRLVEALSAYQDLQKLEETREDIFNEEKDVRVAEAQKFQGNVLMGMKQFQEAENLYVKALEVFKYCLGKQNSLTVELQQTMIELQRHRKKTMGIA